MLPAIKPRLGFKKSFWKKNMSEHVMSTKLSSVQGQDSKPFVLRLVQPRNSTEEDCRGWGRQVLATKVLPANAALVASVQRLWGSLCTMTPSALHQLESAKEGAKDLKQFGAAWKCTCRDTAPCKSWNEWNAQFYEYMEQLQQPTQPPSHPATQPAFCPPSPGLQRQCIQLMVSTALHSLAIGLQILLGLSREHATWTLASSLSHLHFNILLRQCDIHPVSDTNWLTSQLYVWRMVTVGLSKRHISC